MLRKSRPARRNSVKGFASALAMAIALAGGSVVATGAAPTAVAAQEYSDAFVEAYQPVADIVNAEGGDIASVAGQFDAIVALAQNPDEKFAVGNLILTAGNNTTSQPMQRRGLELMLASGNVPPENVAQYSWFVGNLAFNEQDWGAARAALIAAQQAGWSQDDPVGLIAETYYQSGEIPAGISYIKGQAESAAAAGAEVPRQWLLRGLVAAYEEDLGPAAIEAGLMLVKYHPEQQTWMNALQVVNALSDTDDRVQLDMFRLMRQTDTLTDYNEYVRYIEAADPRIMANEVSSLMAEAVAAGEMETNDVYYTEVKSIVDDRVAADRADAPELVAEAEAEAGGQGAMVAGDVLMSIEDYAGAEAMYAMAAAKGGVDANLAALRQGMMQAVQGKAAEAEATLAQVTGPRATIAAFWAAYAQSQAM